MSLSREELSKVELSPFNRLNCQMCLSHQVIGRLSLQSVFPCCLGGWKASKNSCINGCFDNKGFKFGICRRYLHWQHNAKNDRAGKHKSALRWRVANTIACIIKIICNSAGGLNFIANPIA